MSHRTQQQFAEAFGPDNRWYCSQAFGRPIDDKETLLIYYIKSGGAANFDRRYKEAMGDLNRWYCSQFYRRDIREPETLWNYYTKYAPLPQASRRTIDLGGQMDQAS